MILTLLKKNGLEEFIEPSRVVFAEASLLWFSPANPERSYMVPYTSLRDAELVSENGGVLWRYEDPAHVPQMSFTVRNEP